MGGQLRGAEWESESGEHEIGGMGERESRRAGVGKRESRRAGASALEWEGVANL